MTLTKTLAWLLTLALLTSIVPHAALASEGETGGRLPPLRGLAADGLSVIPQIPNAGSPDENENLTGGEDENDPHGLSVIPQIPNAGFPDENENLTGGDEIVAFTALDDDVTAQTVPYTTDGLFVNDVPLTDTLSNAIAAAFVTKDEVTVTGSATDASAIQTIPIPANKKLLWNADYSGDVNDGLLVFNNDGEVEITESGVIKNTHASGFAVALGQGNESDRTTLILNGGHVEAQNGYAIYMQGSSTARINNGTVRNSASSSTYPAINMRQQAALAVYGGTIENTGSGIGNPSTIQSDSNAQTTDVHIYIQGGKVADDSIRNATAAASYHSGAYHDKFFNNSNNPRLIDLSAPTIALPNVAFHENLSVTSVTSNYLQLDPAANGSNIVILQGEYDTDDATLTIEGKLAIPDRTFDVVLNTQEFSTDTPTGAITIGDYSFTDSFSNPAELALFIAQPAEEAQRHQIVITGQDNKGNPITNIQYGYGSNWSSYTSPLVPIPPAMTAVHARIHGKSITTQINTPRMFFYVPNEADTNAVTFNKNEPTGDTVITVSPVMDISPLASPIKDVYIVDQSGGRLEITTTTDDTVTLAAAELMKLPAGEYTVEISYNPSNYVFDEDEHDGDKPVINIPLTITETLYYSINNSTPIAINSPTSATIRTTIQPILNNPNNTTVTVTGAFTNPETDVYLDVGAGRTLVWDAYYTGSLNRELLQLHGDGIAEITPQAYIHNAGTGAAVNLSSNTARGNITLNMEGGTLEGGSNALQVNGNATALLNGGTVKSNGDSNATIHVNDTAALGVYSGAQVIKALPNQGDNKYRLVRLSGTAVAYIDTAALKPGNNSNSE